MLNTHGSEQLQRKGEAELALIDPVDEDLDVNGHAQAFQPAGELLVGDFFLLTKAFDDGLGARLVKPVRVHSLAYMEFGLHASYESAFSFAIDKRNSMYV